MRDLTLRELPHLRATLDRFEPRGRGNCMQQAVALVMDVPRSRLVVGSLYDDERAEGYKHAWVLHRGRYYDPSLYEEEGRLRSHDAEIYVAERRAREVVTVLRSFIMDFARRGALSRWMRGPSAVSHRLSGIMGEVLLVDLGISFALGPNRELWPPASTANAADLS